MNTPFFLLSLWNLTCLGFLWGKLFFILFLILIDNSLQINYHCLNFFIFCLLILCKNLHVWFEVFYCTIFYPTCTLYYYWSYHLLNPKTFDLLFYFVVMIIIIMSIRYSVAQESNRVFVEFRAWNLFFELQISFFSFF